MRSLTARLLLVLLLVGTFVPVALAISAPAPHACCLRKLHQHPSHDAQFEARDSAPRNCCPPVAVVHWAEPISAITTHVTLVATTAHAQLPPLRRHTGVNASHSGRAPPAFSIL
jgi:hypothetical protein